MKTIIMSEQSLTDRDKYTGHLGALGKTAMEHFSQQGSVAA
jgi:hypothetical protein